ncbi:cytochrome P450 [Dissoconium aciculare CBS 342.82]|uniref:Cytochrome P450 n=1 Tax=Dissoconium aciculare CBS 342.82 TaxID=1314786 RepID=A0A6J3LU87_9PEZI|nr:cytochrome P450 [Dissoconium aciculare CBS 342.82]KAF1819203.1 cytochrome P450 [Dissoconium aciculare CBS 342.82]
MELSLWSLIYSVSAVSCLILISYTIYTIFLHPLAKYPGPLLARLTDLHSTYHAVHGDRHLEFQRLHSIYGPIVRFGPNSLSFNSSVALRDIYGVKSNVRKARFYEAFWANKHAASTHSVIDKQMHARKRRVLSQAFSDAAIRAAEKYILVHVREFCENLGGGETKHLRDGRGVIVQGDGTATFRQPVNFADQANYLTFDTLGDLCFGKSFNMLLRPDNRFAIDLIGNAARRHLICGTYLPLHEYHLDKWLFRQIAAGRERYMQYSRLQAAERMSLSSSTAGDKGSKEERKDFFYHLTHAIDPNTGERGFPSPTELWAESNLLIIAGSDTTSTALAATVHYLLHSPRAMEKLTQEVFEVFPLSDELSGGVERITGQSASSIKLPYLRACLDEAMRLSPSVPGLLPREVMPGGATIDGVDIPAGTIVGVPHYTLHRNARYYERVDEYWPERWLVGATIAGGVVTREAVDKAVGAFCPFSIGARGCIGKGTSDIASNTPRSATEKNFEDDQSPNSVSLLTDRLITHRRSGLHTTHHRPGPYYLPV